MMCYRRAQATTYSELPLMMPVKWPSGSVNIAIVTAPGISVTGMTTVAQLSERRWIMTYEFGAPVDPANPDQANYTYHVHYRIATDPESFRFSEDIPLLDQGGYAPNASPVVSWSDSGGRNGTIVVTALGGPGRSLPQVIALTCAAGVPSRIRKSRAPAARSAPSASA